MKTANTYVLSLGGSLIYPDDGIDHKFLKNFIRLITERTERGDKFIIVCGGGGVNRIYNQAAQKIRPMNDLELDWLGIHATRYNAQLLRLLFGKLAYKEVLINPYERVKTDKPVIIGAGYEPGWSSDYDAVYLANTYSIKKIANLSNIDYACDKDPCKFKDAVKIKDINWSDFRKIVGDKWEPRMSKPFDPIASREAEKLGLEVSILNGKKLKNVEKYLDGGKFIGTIIHP
jgi:uridylate kinase